jgi:hypothetical protein
VEVTIISRNTAFVDAITAAWPGYFRYAILNPSCAHRARRHPAPGWRNWQTQRTQNPPGFGPWGFDSPSRHQPFSLGYEICSAPAAERCVRSVYVSQASNHVGAGPCSLAQSGISGRRTYSCELPYASTRGATCTWQYTGSLGSGWDGVRSRV